MGGGRIECRRSSGACLADWGAAGIQARNVAAVRFALATSHSCSSVRMARQTTPLCTWGSVPNSLAWATENACPTTNSSMASFDIQFCGATSDMAAPFCTNWVPIQPARPQRDPPVRLRGQDALAPGLAKAVRLRGQDALAPGLAKSWGRRRTIRCSL